MKAAWVVAVGVVGIAACVSRPRELERLPELDSECTHGGVGFTYPISAGAAVSDRAVAAGCYAPIGAWTDDRDRTAGGTRQRIFELRERERLTVLCCKE